MSDFVKVRSRRKVNGIRDPEIANENNINILEENLEIKKNTLKESKLFETIIDALKAHKFTKIRCVALGSPSQEEPALFQLALLLLIIEKYGVQCDQVSLYDPVFTVLDNEFLKSLKFEVKEEYIPNGDDSILFFLPHAPLSLTNQVISEQNPKLLLANNIQTHTTRLTKTELFEKYPVISKLVSLLIPEETLKDDFEPVVKKKNRRQRSKFTEPKIDHSKVETYFEKIDLLSFKKFEEGEWLNSFTDIAFHVIS